MGLINLRTFYEYIAMQALKSGALRVGGVVTEGSAGSTAVSLAMVAMAHGCRCHVVLPDDAAIEKVSIILQNLNFL
jgi:cysteine synthase A